MRRTSSIWALLALALVSMACGTSPPPAPTPIPTARPLTSVSISVASPAVSGLPLYVAVQEGFFKAHGVDMTPMAMAANVGQTALMKGEIQFLSSPTDAITGAANGLPFKIIYSAWERAPWTLVGKAELATMADVRGKTIGTTAPAPRPTPTWTPGCARLA